MGTTYNPYTKSVQINYCPSSPGPATSSTSMMQANYGVNCNIIPKANAAPATSLAAITSPSKKYLVMDFNEYIIESVNEVVGVAGGGGQYYLPGAGLGGVDCSSAQYSDCKTGRHFDGINIAFADGHAKWLKSSLVVDQARRYNNGDTSAWGLSIDAP